MSGRRWLLALAALTVLRWLLAGQLELSPDEAYYWLWSKSLQGGYYDHPPMVALWIRAGTLLFGDTAFGVRFLGPLSVALGSLLVWRIAEDLAPARNAGVSAAAALNATLLMGAGSIIMTPDTPLVFFWTLTLFCAARLWVTGNGLWWLATGLAIGAAMTSKYTTVFLVAGVLLWVLVLPDIRRWLLRPQPWLGALLALAVFAPVILWNAGHDWAGLLKQGGRVGAGGGLQFRFLPELLGGQIGLATPLLFVLFAVGTWSAAGAARRRSPAAVLLVASLAPAILYFLIHALRDRVQANWPAAIYPAAAIAAAIWIGPRLSAWWRPAMVVGFGFTALAYIQAATGLVPLPARSDPTLLRLAGWTALGGRVADVLRADGGSFVAVEEYGLAAELRFALPAAVPVIVVGDRWGHFTFSAASATGPGLYVRSERRGQEPPASFAGATRRGTLARQRGETVAERYVTFAVTAPAQTQAFRLPVPDR
jgi:4-amino-4-deoxy-L-arabinose transferase-like glycosyltransferase